MSCPHDISERENAVYADGLCPICQATKLDRIRNEIIEECAQLFPDNRQLECSAKWAREKILALKEKP